MDLYNELETKIQELELSIRSLRKTGQNYAEAERDYKILLRQEVLKLRDEGQAIGVITLTCYGIPSVAEYGSQLEAILNHEYSAGRITIPIITIKAIIFLPIVPKSLVKIRNIFPIHLFLSCVLAISGCDYPVSMGERFLPRHRAVPAFHGTYCTDNPSSA